MFFERKMCFEKKKIKKNLLRGGKLGEQGLRIGHSRLRREADTGWRDFNLAPNKT